MTIANICRPSPANVMQANPTKLTGHQFTVLISLILFSSQTYCAWGVAARTISASHWSVPASARAEIPFHP